MPPKMSLVLFNRLCSIDLVAFEKIVKNLEDLQPSHPHYIQDAIILYSLLKKEHDILKDKFDSYLLLEELPEGLEECVLSAGVSKLDDLFKKGELLYNRISPNKSLDSSSCNPPVNSTELNFTTFNSLNNSSMLTGSELPRLSIPTFDGSVPSQFNEFYAKFNSLVHENTLLTSKQKLLYLINHLRGSAYDKVALLPINDESYSIALKTLCDRYQNTKLLFKSYCQKLLQLPSVSYDSPSSMRDFIDLFNLNHSYLLSLGDKNIFEHIYVCFMLSNFDMKLRLKFEADKSDVTSLPLPSDVISFLSKFAEQKESAATTPFPSLKQPKPTSNWKSKSNFKNKPSKSFVNSTKSATSLTVSHINSCLICCNKHSAAECPQILKLSPRERYKLIKTNKICVSCLNSRHEAPCNPMVNCDSCGSNRHHSLLHFGDSKPTPSASVPEPLVPTSATPIPTSTCMAVTSVTSSTLMATSLVRIQVNSNRFMIVRAILDSASQLSFISESCAQRLGVKRYNDSTRVSGIGLSTPPPSRGRCNLMVGNLSGHLISESHMFHILPQIAQITPRLPVSSQVIRAVEHLVLADPTFGRPSKVDALLGADLVAASLNGPIVPLGNNMPVAMSTIFGFVIMGTAPVALNNELQLLPSSSPPSPDRGEEQSLYTDHDSLYDSSALLSMIELPLESPSDLCLLTNLDDESDLNYSLNRFWELEEPPQAGPFNSEEELQCEEYYVSTTTRLPSGRFVVRLPFKQDHVSLLGSSYGEALSRLRSLERKFVSNPDFKSLYVDFMRDYISQGHMSLVNDLNFPKYYIPHHGIFKTHGDPSKIRVVFDASSRSSSGYSLNDVLMTGKGLQPLISDVLTLFRRYEFVFCADIQQMFRQILVHSDDCAYQCILWRENQSDPILTYSLLTVTYGTTCAPYLAIRSLKKLAQDEGAKFPLAKRLLEENTFIDDIAGGSRTLSETVFLVKELIDLLSKGGFVLKKWASNHPSILSDIHSEDQTTHNLHRILGLCWDPDHDTLSYPANEMISNNNTCLTKRLVMSQTARLYDPCGFIAPIVMKAKCFMQTLWRSSLTWDDPLPNPLALEWKDYSSSLFKLSEFSIPRLLNAREEVQLHGFSDASQSGYAACLYIRSAKGLSFSCRLLTAKAKVSPLKPLSIPRLELQGAHLLSKLVYHYRNLLKTHVLISDIFLWTDSTIVLQWIKTPPHLLKTFVSNRVVQISDFTDGAHWRHVASEDNPADLASRGMTASTFLLKYDFWLNGPPWLSCDMSFWPDTCHNSVSDPDLLELKSIEPCSNALLSIEYDVNLFSSCSSWLKTLKIVSVIIKWLPKVSSRNLTSLDLFNLSHDYVMRHIQLSAFGRELSCLDKGHGNLPISMQRLSPFLDNFGLIRAKGRLSNSEFGTNPIILPKHHYLVSLLIHHTHVKLGHAGPQHVRYILSLNYWILAARQIIRSVISKCVVCFRVKPKSLPPLMADLPPERVNPAPVFYNTGMDFCGPFLVKSYALRKAPLVKTYLCIFICMAVKAVHLELSLDLSTDAFLDVLRRFISRRGCPKRLFCDCGTNFTGADRALRHELSGILKNPDNSPMIKNFSLENKIEFSFLPSFSPSMGGLWERAVQSTKFHLRRVIGKNILTAQQLNSLIIQIEGILNSRPITALSTEPNDFQALTPGHFITGRPITAPPERDVSLLSDGVLGHYQMIQALLGRFWKQWKLEYLSSLQARSKWYKKNPNLSVGDLVVVEEPNSMPLQWPLGRITQVFPSSDGTVRKVEVQTTSGKYLRSALKLYRLPIY